MGKPRKMLLTEQIAWRDLIMQKASYRELPALIGVICCLLSAIFLTASGITVVLAGGSSGKWMLLIAAGSLVLAKWLYGLYKKIDIKYKSSPLDIEALVFDTDVCINKEEETDSDGDSFCYLTFEKGGRNGAGKLGLPSYDYTEVGDRFFVVSLKSDPNRKQYYSFNNWCLEYPEEEENS